MPSHNMCGIGGLSPCSMRSHNMDKTERKKTFHTYQIGLWKGDLTLKHLTMKTNALEKYCPDASLSIHEGRIDYFHLKVN